MPPVVRVGVGALIQCSLHPACVLVGRRKNSHGAGRLALPGGHLELNERFPISINFEVKVIRN